MCGYGLKDHSAQTRPMEGGNKAVVTYLGGRESLPASSPEICWSWGDTEKAQIKWRSANRIRMDIVPRLNKYQLTKS